MTYDIVCGKNPDGTRCFTEFKFVASDSDDTVGPWAVGRSESRIQVQVVVPHHDHVPVAELVTPDIMIRDARYH